MVKLNLYYQAKSPKREIRRSGNAAVRISVVGRGVCTVAPSCWNRMFSSANSSSRRRGIWIWLCNARPSQLSFTITWWLLRQLVQQKLIHTYIHMYTCMYANKMKICFNKYRIVVLEHVINDFDVHKSNVILHLQSNWNWLFNKNIFVRLAIKYLWFA